MCMCVCVNSLFTAQLQLYVGAPAGASCTASANFLPSSSVTGQFSPNVILGNIHVQKERHCLTKVGRGAAVRSQMSSAGRPPLG